MTRAVLMKWTPTTHRCEGCNLPIIGHKGRRPAICCNVYDGPRWDRVAYFHVDHYDLRYGPVIDRGQLPPGSRTAWTHA